MTTFLSSEGLKKNFIENINTKQRDKRKKLLEINYAGNLHKKLLKTYVMKFI